MILTLQAHTKLTFMDYLLTMLRSLLRRKQVHDNNANEDRHVTQDYVWWCGGSASGASKLKHVVDVFISPQVMQCDVNPEQKVHEYDYSKLYSGNGTKLLSHRAADRGCRYIGMPCTCTTSERLSPGFLLKS